ncbi:MAG TPA: C25 family cysteine peptidase [Bacteroidales bacterium]|nr:C25 family cysteine peptidase [Bacteroidales bacterium]
MKRSLVLILAIMLTYAGFGQSRVLDAEAVKVLNMSSAGLQIEVTAPQFEIAVIKTEAGMFNSMVVQGMVARTEAGMPFLPAISRLIQVPENAQVLVDIDYSHYTDYDLSSISGNAYQLMPYQPGVSKSHTGEIPFYYNNAAYKINDFCQNERVAVDIHGNLRNIRMASLDIHLFDYNPVSNTLRVYDKLILNISFPGGDAVLTNQLSEKYADVCFAGPVARLINHEAFIHQRDTASHYPIKMIIVADTMFHDALQPFIAWKTKKGFIVDEAYTSNPAVGTTTTSISNYLQAKYDNATTADPAPTFILIVGDVAQIPAFSGTAGSHYTDMYYAEFTGDMIADAYFGRFSATNVDQLLPQIDKTLEYEQYLFPSESWLDTVVMIAGADASWAPTHANGQINYGTTYYFNATNGIYSWTHLYPASASDDAIIRTEIGNGVALANYTAHGYSDGWGDPSFDKTDIPSMNNAHQYPLMIGNACSTNTFYESECFGEALLRTPMKGAIGYIGGSNSTYWDEDFYWGVGVRTTINANPVYDANNLGAYDRTWHITGEPFSEWFVSQGQMILAGNLAVLEGSPSSFDYYSEIYHLMGDPSLMVYLSVPSQLSVTHPALVPLGQNTITVSTEPYAYVGVSQNGVWHGAGMADATGNVVIEIIPFTTPGTADIVGTKQFRKPFVSSFVVQTPSGPYVLMENKSIDDAAANNNQQADIMETVGLNVRLKNYGLQNDSTVYAILSSSDPYVEIVDSIGLWGLIASNDTLTLNNAFTVKIDTLVPDQYMAPFQISIRDSSGHSWSSDFNLKINAPLLQILNLTINDAVGGNGNNKLDAGETVAMNIQVVNNGHSHAWDASALLSSVSPYLTITSAAWQHDSLFTGIAETGTYTVEVSSSAPMGTAASVTLNLSALSVYQASQTFNRSIGQIDEDWESGDLTQYEWVTGGGAPWIITSGSPYEGSFAAQSGNITDNQQSDLSITIDVLSDDSLSFYKKVSSEQGWDFLKFFVNGTSMGEWSGELAWSQERFWITAGTKTLKWSYIKDYSYYDGDDAAWIDYIVFPPMYVVTSDIELPSAENDLLVYPNPATNGFVTVTAPVISGDVQLTIVASDGRLVYSENYHNISGRLYLPVSVYEWEPGIYTVHLNGDQVNFSRSFAVIK